MCHSGSPMVQCSPVQPWWQSHLPSRQTPWSMQRGWQSLCSHSGPVQPSSHWHTPLMHDPWGPQSTTQTSVVRERKSHGDMLLLYREKEPFLLVLDSCIFVCWVDASATAEEYSNGCCEAVMPLNKVGKLSWTKQDESPHCSWMQHARRFHLKRFRGLLKQLLISVKVKNLLHFIASFCLDVSNIHDTWHFSSQSPINYFCSHLTNIHIE